MKGDFSKWGFNPADNYRGVLHQQGRVLLDSDWNAQALVSAHVDEIIGRDAFGPGVAAVPAALPDSLKVIQATTDGTSVTLTLKPGRLWADGVPLYLGKGAPVDLQATYLPLPFNSPVPAVSSIAAGTRDAVVLEVWDEAVSGFQKPFELLEAALGGPDTTERAQAAYAMRLLRLSANEDCSTLAARLADDFGAKGKLTVTPAPSLSISGPCPVETGGGYTGFEHYLYRIEIGEPKAGEARFKWSQFNGGLVGSGKFDSVAGTVAIEANNQAINHCGLTGFYLEALRFNDKSGHWEVFFAAAATLPQDDKLALTPDWGTWPAATDTVFFRLWNGIEKIADFPLGGTPKELKDGIRLQFQAPVAGNANYAPGDYWTFPVRAAGVPFDPSVWPSNASPQGVRYHRVPLAVVNWAAGGTASWDKGEIDDCRRVFRPLTNQKLCCSFTVGDGKSSHGDFDSIEEALRHLPKRGGEICLLPGLHETNTLIEGRRNVRIKGCGRNSKVIPRENAATEPIFRIADSREIVLENMEMASLEGTAIVLEGSKPGGVGPVEIAHNRILAYENAIRTKKSAGVNIHHNHLRMLDKEGAGVAVYLAADDSLIERNQIGVAPAASIPHFEPPGGKDVIHPNDRCAKMNTVYATPGYYYGYLNMVWAVAAVFQAGTIYEAQGGIQIAGSSERVKVLENAIHGGAGNGITLGSSIDLEELFGQGGEEDQGFEIASTGDMRGLVVDEAGKPVAGFQLSFTDAAGVSTSTLTSATGTFREPLATGHYQVTEASPAWAIKSVENVSDLDATGKLASNRTLYRITLGKAEEKPTLDLDVFGFLYDIDIERNEISGMGRNGIGLALIDLSGSKVMKAFKATTAFNRRLVVLLRMYALFGNPVMGLAIRNNQIAHCLQTPFDAAMAGEAKLRGLGGVSLGLCEDLSITENHIEDNGLRHIDPVCGIYAAYSEGAEIRRNRIVNNGPLAVVPAGTDMTVGRRGGIVLNLTAALSVLGKLTGELGSVLSPRPAASVHENTVDQPAGQSLYALAFGPVVCTDNYLNNELSGNSGLDRMGGSVLIWNLGGLQNSLGYAQATASYIQPHKAQAPSHAAEEPAKAMRISTKLSEMTNFSRAEAVNRIFPSGATLFNANQVRSGPGGGSFFSQLIASMDDVGYGENQSYSHNQGLISNCAAVGTTVRASNNRFRESAPATLLSLFSLSRLMNTTTFNQGDHCIIATNMGGPLHEVDMGNQVLAMTNLCTGLNLIADNLFKVKG